MTFDASDKNCSRFCHSMARWPARRMKAVHQGGALQRVIAALARELAARQLAHVLVDQRPQRFERRGVTIGPALQKSGDLTGILFFV